MKKKFKKVWIIGAGAIGSVLSAVLTIEKRIENYLVGQSSHAYAMREKGLVFQIDDNKFESLPISLKFPREVPTLTENDLVLMAQKTNNLTATAVWLKDRCHPQTGIIALQNGIGPEKILEKALGRPIDRGLAFFGANTPKPGMVRYFSGKILLRRFI